MYLKLITLLCYIKIIEIMKTITFFTMATLGLSCESVYLSLLCACVCLILIAKTK